MPGITPETVNAEQKTAIQHGLGPLLIVAGAGTGKTTVITERIAWLIMKKKVSLDGVLALTFTDKAATEMEERVDRLLPYGYVNLWISTFHAFCERLLRDHALDIGLPADFRLLNQTEQWLLVRRNFDRFELDYYRPLGNPTRFITALLKHFSRLEDEDIAPEEYIEYARSLKLDRDEEHFTKKQDESDMSISEARRITEVAQAYATYRQLLLDESSLDFGMLITSTLRLFKERPAILEKYRQQFKYILVDEFQDTNWSQYELMKLLAAPKNNLTVVGDDDQSIYKFRGASISNILQFQKDFPKSKQVVLTQNYRSRQNILDLAYKFIQLNNPNRLEVSLPTAKKGKRKQTTPTISKQLRAVAADKGLVEFIHVPTKEQESRGVAEKILKLQQTEKIEWREFAILVRANDQADEFIHALELAGIPYQFVASRGLYRQPDILDMLSYLRLLDNYHESAALYRILNMPLWHIRPEDVVELSSYARRKGISLYQALIQSRAIPSVQAASRKGIDAVLHLIRSGTAFTKSHQVSQVLYDFLKQAGVLADIGRKGSFHPAERVATIRKFLDEVNEFDKLHPHSHPRDFLELFAMKLDAGDAGSLSGTMESEVDAVRVMTVHGAKGLEFTHVFIVQLVDRRFPTTERKDPIEIPEPLVREILPAGDVHLQEERRLLYVAMTRARRGLFFTAAEDYGGVRVKKPSRFLYELGFLQELEAQAGGRPLSFERQERRPSHAPDLRFAGSKYSFSGLRSYQKCPWQFRYAYILKVPVAGNGLLSFGETMHATLQKFFGLWVERRGRAQSSLFGKSDGKSSAKPLVSLDELLRIYEEAFIDEWYESETAREKFKERGRLSLRAFYENHAPAMPEVIGLEQDFNLKLDRFTVTGKMDRVDRLGHDAALKKDVVGIVDYKSGSKRRSALETGDRYQLLIYALAAQDPNILNAKVERLSYYFLDGNDVLDLPINDQELRSAAGWVKDIIGKIQSGNFEATPGMVCRFCDYRDICEFRDPNY